MPWTLDGRFKTAENRAIVAFIEREQPSAHDDVAHALTESARDLPDTRSHCPDLHGYAYMVLHTADNTIFGLAFGMRSLAYRMPRNVIRAALADGGTAWEQIGDEWVLFQSWGMPARLRHWCKMAHDHAVGSGAPDRTRRDVQHPVRRSPAGVCAGRRHALSHRVRYSRAHGRIVGPASTPALSDSRADVTRLDLEDTVLGRRQG